MRRRLEARAPRQTEAKGGGEQLAATLDQLERAELYVVAALDLQADDPDRRRLLESLRAQIAAARRSLVTPRVVA